MERALLHLFTPCISVMLLSKTGFVPLNVSREVTSDVLAANATNTAAKTATRFIVRTCIRSPLSIPDQGTTYRRKGHFVTHEKHIFTSVKST